jgi:2Fe-2S ferredoxin
MRASVPSASLATIASRISRCCCQMLGGGSDLRSTSPMTRRRKHQCTSAVGPIDEGMERDVVSDHRLDGAGRHGLEAGLDDTLTLAPRVRRDLGRGGAALRRQPLRRQGAIGDLAEHRFVSLVNQAGLGGQEHRGDPYPECRTRHSETAGLQAESRGTRSSRWRISLWDIEIAGLPRQGYDVALCGPVGPARDPPSRDQLRIDMPSVIFMHPDGRRDTVEAANGGSIMLAALRSGINGMVAECGGSAVCATCHVFVEPNQLALLEPMYGEEDELLDSTAVERRPNSRLSCRIKMSPKLGGLIVHLPDRQT